MRIFELLEKINYSPWRGNPQIGWWEDQTPLILYHGTHQSKIQDILKSKLVAPTQGPTADWVSLALEPNTAFGYASMRGGESAFRAAGSKAINVPSHERAVLILSFPGGKEQLLKLGMDQTVRGNDPQAREKLLNKNLYNKWKSMGKSDQEYYALTELRLPKQVDRKYIVGVMKK